MIAALPKLKEAPLQGARNATRAETNAAEKTAVPRSRSSRKTAETLASPDASSTGEIKFEGNPEDQVIVFDLDETLVAGDKHPIKGKREEQINAMGDREVQTISKDDPDNKLDFEIKYVLRPGAKELLEYLHSRGYKIIASTRNYPEYAEAICKKDPVLSKYIDANIGRTDLMSETNKDFKKYPNHPDRLGFFGKIGAWLKRTFVYGPKFLWWKFKSVFNGKNVRWNPPYYVLGKYPPNMIDILKSHGVNKFDDCKPARFLVDNRAQRELRDSKKSGDFAVINPNIDRNGDGTPEEFFSDSPVPKDSEGRYIWVKNVIEGVERGWREQFKHTTGKEAKV